MKMTSQLDAIDTAHLKTLVEAKMKGDLRLEAFVEYLFIKHGLKAGTDSINADGAIMRHASETQ